MVSAVVVVGAVVGGGQNVTWCCGGERSADVVVCCCLGHRYHQALGLRPADTFAADMLKRALEESLDTASEWMNQLPEEP